MEDLDLKLAVPRNISQEWVSIAVVRALCAQAGLNVMNWQWDDGLDLTIGSAKKGCAGVRTRNVTFHLQVKSTVNWCSKNGQIAYRIRREKYNELVEDSAGPQFLVLYTLPRPRWQWVQSRDDHAALSHCAYYRGFEGQKPHVGTESFDLLIPMRNRLTAGELLRMYRASAQLWKRP